MRAELQQHGIMLEIRVAGDLPLVAADSLQLQQVVLNILRNSIESIVEAGRYDGRITVAVETTPSGTAQVHIRDNGPGFDPAMVDQGIFPFATTKAGGMGLGLSLSRSIIELHGGRLSIDGDATGGVVTFALPAADQRTGSR